MVSMAEGRATRERKKGRWRDRKTEKVKERQREVQEEVLRVVTSIG